MRVLNQALAIVKGQARYRPYKALVIKFRDFTVLMLNLSVPIFGPREKAGSMTKKQELRLIKDIVYVSGLKIHHHLLNYLFFLNLQCQRTNLNTKDLRFRIHDIRCSRTHNDRRC